MRNRGPEIAVLIVAIFMAIAWGVRAYELGLVEGFKQWGIVLLAATLAATSAVRGMWRA